MQSWTCLSAGSVKYCTVRSKQLNLLPLDGKCQLLVANILQTSPCLVIRYYHNKFGIKRTNLSQAKGHQYITRYWWLLDFLFDGLMALMGNREKEPLHEALLA